VTGPVPARGCLRSLCGWANRLSSRGGIAWAIQAFNGKKGLSTDELVELMLELTDRASRADVPSEIKTIWRLLYRATHDRRGILGRYNVEKINVPFGRTPSRAEMLEPS